MTTLAEKLKSLPPKKRRLLELELKKKGIELSKFQIPPRPEDRPSYPLSWAQQRLWFIDQLVPDNNAYHIPMTLRLEGPLDVAALGRALDRIVARHEALRTIFGTDGDGQPVQIVRDPAGQRLSVVDLKALEGADRQRVAERFGVTHGSWRFDLATGPLLRTFLLRLGEGEHVFLASMHHIVSDGWSMSVLIGELTTLYQAYSEGRPAELKRLPIQYADFALWQREWLEHQDQGRQLRFWQEHLDGAPVSIELPFDRPRPAVQSFRGSTRSLVLGEARTTALRALAKREGKTLFVILMSAYEALLRRYTDSRDLVVGTPIANRNREETEGLIGFFVNMMAVRIELGAGLDFRELLDRVWRAMRDASDHQDVPIEKVVEDLKIERNLSHNPLFQTVFRYLAQMPGGERAEVSSLSFRQLGADVGATPFDLLLTVHDPGLQRMLVVLDYAVDLFDATTVRRLLRHYDRFLEHLCADLEARPDEVPILSGSERHQLLEEWNDTARPRSGEVSMVAPFERQAARRPDAVAVISDDEELTYGQLDERANRLAHHLRALGVERGDYVAIFLERSAEMVTALLAIHKAGGAYAPIESKLPNARVEWILDHLSVRVMLTHQPLAGRVGELDSCLEHAVFLDPEGEPRAESEGGPRRWLWHELDGLSSRRPEPVIGRGDIAYIIFTSGSTGTPKGVVVRHDAALNLIEWVNGTYEVSAADRVLFITSLSFDLSVYDVFGLLAAGGSIRVVSSDDLRDPARLVEMLVEEPITYWDSAPAALQQLVPFLPAEPAREARLRLVFLSGDWIPVTLPGRVRHVFPGARVIGLGGATEATVWSNYHPIDRVDPLWVSIPYGRPITNAAYHVLDHRLAVVPVGVPGDLYIGDECLASGYSDPVRTALQFIPDPYAVRPGSRLYQTGDRARYFADGELEFLGRLDHQVKIRGFRIELGEIETVLGEHPAVEIAAILARPTSAGHKQLVAFVVFKSEGDDATVRDLRTFLGEKLPEYMVPPIFVVLDALPVTANGKLDRGALAKHPLPGEEGAVDEASDEDYEAPRNAAEEELAAIWSAVLRRPRVSIHDNFFELGGDSILSIQIVARASKAGLHLSPRQVFQYQTVAELAAVAGSEEKAVAEQGLVLGDVLLTPAQHWFFEQPSPARHHFNQAVLLRLEPGFDAARLPGALGSVLAHHDALRLRFEPLAGGGWRQWSAGLGEETPFTRFDLSGHPPESLREEMGRLAATVHGSLDLARGPLLRLAHFDLGPEREGRLLFVIHHLAVDGVSCRILLQDFEAAYRALAAGHEVELPPKTTSFRQWGEKLRELAGSGALDGEREYWLDPRRAEVRSLPVDDSAASNVRASSQRLSVSLSEDDTSALLHEVPGAYRTQINDVLMTGLLLALQGWTGSRFALVEAEGHGREEELVDGVDLSLTVGWFTAFYPLLLEAPEEGGVGAAIRAVKETLRGVPSHGLGHGVLRHLHPDEELRRDLAELPRPEIVFNYLGQLDQAIEEDAALRPAPESPGPLVSREHPRRYLIEVDANVAGGRLNAAWTFGARHRRETVQGLADAFLDGLRAIIEHCRSPAARGTTPSDFPLAVLDQAALDRLLAERPDAEDVYTLGPTQHGLLFFHLYAPASEAYFQQFRLLIGGDLDLDAFKGSWDRVINHHPALRSSFFWEGVAEPHQVVHRHFDLPWHEEDWRELEREEQHDRLALFRQEDRRRGLDLARVPMRLALIRLRDDVYSFTFSYHHVLFDGWCVPLLMQQGVAVYQALVQGREPQLPPSRPYRDYIAWLRTKGDDEAEAFWRRCLAGFTRPTRLPVDLNPGALPSQEGDYRNLGTTLTSEMMAGLSAFALEHQLTLNTLIQGAWGLVLHHYSGERDVVFGVVSSGRPPQLEGVESMIGLFITTLPLRIRVEPEKDLGGWLRELQDQQLEAREYEHCPLVQVQQWSEVSGDHPLFDGIQIFENYPTDQSDDAPEVVSTEDDAGELRRGSVEEESDPPSSPSPRGHLTIRDAGMQERPSYPMAVIVGPGETPFLGLGYETDRFDGTTVRRMLTQLRHVLAGMASGGRVGERSLLTAIERHQLTHEHNDTATGVPWQQSLAELFAEQVTLTPRAPAAACDGTELTYRELDERAGRLAGRLAAEGVGPDVVVALLADRGLDFLAAILGVMRAGGAYLPLDPAHPAGRLARVLLQSGAPRVLVGESYGALLRDALASMEGAEQPAVLGLEDVLAGAGSALERQAPGHPGNLAYVIYTSGSTGVPKGAMVERRGMINHLYAKIRDLELTPADTVAQTASQCFDISVWQFLAPLLVGGRVEIFGDAIAHDPAELAPAVEKRGVTVLETVPSLMRLLLDELEVPAGGSQALELPSLRWLIPTGEALPPELCRQWLAAYPAIPLLNAYGPTECSDDVSHYRLDRPPGDGVVHVPIGRTVSNLHLSVRDRRLDAKPLLVPGELCVGGLGVGRGYLRDPRRTAEIFVPGPDAGKPGERLYRTGDLARFLTDGNVEFQGRLDHQVKVRGFRIELGEIESVLAEHPAVAQAVVTVRDDGGEARLAAYLVPAEAETLEVRELREFLLDALPDYMVPSFFVPLDALPLQTSGKVDRAALPAPGETPAGEDGYVAPRDELEARLAGIWEEILGTRPIGVRQGFFDLGGHSLLAIRLMSRLRDEIGRRLPLATLFEASTVEALAAVLRMALATPDGVARPRRKALVPIQPRGDRPPIFCVHPVGGNVLCYAELARRLGDDQPFYGLQVPELEPGAEPLDTVEALAGHYLDVVRDAARGGSFRLAGWSMGGLVAYEMARRLEAAGDAVATPLLIDVATPELEPASRELDEADLLAQFAGDLGGLRGRGMAVTARELRTMSAEDGLRRVAREAQRAGLLPPDLGLDELRELARVFATNFRAMLRYRPGPFGGTLSLLRASESLPGAADATLGWGRLVAGGVDVRRVPGTHYSILGNPGVEILAAELDVSLNPRDPDSSES